MKYLVFIVLLFTMACNEPDFYTCPESTANDMAKYIIECDEETGGTLGSCTESAQKTFCQPGYKPQASKTEVEIEMEKEIETIKEETEAVVEDMGF